MSVVAASDGPFVDRARALGVDVAVLPFPARLARWGNGGPGASMLRRVSLAGSCLIAAGATLGYAWRLRRVIASRAPDIVQSNGVKMHLLATWVAPRAAAVVWHVHDYVSTRALTSRALRVDGAVV